MERFTGTIRNWRDWGRVFRSIGAFEPLARHILRTNGLPEAALSPLTPGTNAVFRAGDFVVKIYAPRESGRDQTPDMETELFCADYARERGVAVPDVAASGFVEDKYRFGYTVTEFVPGAAFGESAARMDADAKAVAGRALRRVADLLNRPCEPFNAVDVFDPARLAARFTSFPRAFRAERLDYVARRDWGEPVFVHNDLTADNVLVGIDGDFVLLDFADAALAPVCCEHAIAAAELFGFDPDLMRGFFGDPLPDGLAETVLAGLLLHGFGDGVVAQRLGEPRTFGRLDDLREAIAEKLEA